MSGLEPEPSSRPFLYASLMLVALTGLEPVRITPADFKSAVTTDYTIAPNIKAAIYTCRAASPRSEVYI